MGGTPRAALLLVYLLCLKSCIDFIFFFFGCTAWHMGSWFPDQGSNLQPLQCKCSLNHGTARKALIWLYGDGPITGQMQGAGRGAMGGSETLGLGVGRGALLGFPGVWV